MTTVSKDYLIELQEKHEDNLSEEELNDSMHYEDNIGIQYNDALLHAIDYMECEGLDEIVLEDHSEENDEYPVHDVMMKLVSKYLKEAA